MTDYTITISQALYERVRQAAEESHRPIDDVIRSRLEEALSLDIPADERAELMALVYLSDDTLWTIAREQMPRAKQDIMQSLMDKNTFGTITDVEHEELTRLVESGQRLTLRKAHAIKLLQERGYEVRLDLLKPD